MPSPSVSDKLLDKAAELRALGLGWELIGPKVHRSADRVSRWPREYPIRWAAALKRAEKDNLQNAAAESVNILRNQMRLKDEKLKQSAATSLLKHQSTVAKKPARKKAALKTATGPALRLAEYVEALSDADLDQLLGEMADEPEASPAIPGDAAAGEADAPSPAGAERLPGVLLRGADRADDPASLGA